MKATTTALKISSRASVKVGESFYTVEYCEERSVPHNLTEDEIEEERLDLWDVCNTEVDKQIEEIFKIYSKK